MGSSSPSGVHLASLRLRGLSARVLAVLTRLVASSNRHPLAQQRHPLPDILVQQPYHRPDAQGLPRGPRSHSISPILYSSRFPPAPSAASSTTTPSPPRTLSTFAPPSGASLSHPSNSHLSTAETSLFSDGEEESDGGGFRSGFGWQGGEVSIPGLEGWDGSGAPGGASSSATGTGGNSFADDLVVIDEDDEEEGGDLHGGYSTAGGGGAGEEESEAEPAPRYPSTSTSTAWTRNVSGGGPLPSFRTAREDLLVDVTPPPSTASEDEGEDTRARMPPAAAGASFATHASRSLSTYPMPRAAGGLQHALGTAENRPPEHISHLHSYSDTLDASRRGAPTAADRQTDVRSRVPSNGSNGQALDSVRRLREAFARAQASPPSSPGTAVPSVRRSWEASTTTPLVDAQGSKTAAVQSWLSTSHSLERSEILPAPPAQSAREFAPIRRAPVSPERGTSFVPLRKPRSSHGFAVQVEVPLPSSEDESPPTPPLRVPPGFGRLHHSAPDHSRSTAYEEELTPAPTYTRKVSPTPPHHAHHHGGNSLKTYLESNPVPTPGYGGRSGAVQREPQPSPTMPSRISRQPTGRTQREGSARKVEHTSPTLGRLPPVLTAAAAQPISPRQHRSRTGSATPRASRSQQLHSSKAAYAPPSPSAHASRSAHDERTEDEEEDESLAFRPSRQLRREPSLLGTPAPAYSAAPAPAESAHARTRDSPTVITREKGKQRALKESPRKAATEVDVARSSDRAPAEASYGDSHGHSHSSPERQRTMTPLHASTRQRASPRTSPSHLASTNAGVGSPLRSSASRSRASLAPPAPSTVPEETSGGERGGSHSGWSSSEDEAEDERPQVAQARRDVPGRTSVDRSPAGHASRHTQSIASPARSRTSAYTASRTPQPPTDVSDLSALDFAPPSPPGRHGAHAVDVDSLSEAAAAGLDESVEVFDEEDEGGADFIESGGEAQEAQDDEGAFESVSLASPGRSHTNAARDTPAGVPNSLPLTPPRPTHSSSPRHSPSPSPSALRTPAPAAKTPAREAVMRGAATPRAPGGWGWTPGGREKGKARAVGIDEEVAAVEEAAEGADDEAGGREDEAEGDAEAEAQELLEEEVVVLRRRTVESPARQVAPTPPPKDRSLTLLSTPSLLRRTPSLSTAKPSPLGTPQHISLRKLSFTLGSPVSPLTPSRLRIAHLRKRLGEVEAEELRARERVDEVQREVEQVRWVQARRSERGTGRWIKCVAWLAVWWVGLSLLHTLYFPPPTTNSPFHPALYAPPPTPLAGSPLLALTAVLPDGLSAFELPGKVRAGWAVGVGRLVEAVGGPAGWAGAGGGGGWDAPAGKDW